MEIEDKLIIAKLMDKIEISKTRNKIINTEFLTIYQKEIIKKQLNKIKFKNYIFFGGYNEAEAESLIIYPGKLDIEIVKNNLKNIIKAIRIILPNDKEVIGKYTHRDYLGAVMKAGLNRDRIGDILVHQDKGYIIVLNENAEYIAEFLKSLTIFSKAKIQIIDYNEIELKKIEFEEIKITVSSMRFDNIVSEIIKSSREKACKMIIEEKVFINSKVETKGTKEVKEKDIIAIRGHGKYIINEIIGQNKKGKIIILVYKYK